MINKNGTLNTNISEIGPTDGLVIWLPLDGDIEDYAGNNTVVLSNAIKDTGLNQSCYNFSTSGSYIRINTPTNLPIGNTPITATAWFYKLGNGSGDFYPVVWPGTSGTKTITNFGIRASNGYMASSLYGGAYENDSTLLIDNNKWYFGAVSWDVDNKIIKLYNGDIVVASRTINEDVNRGNALYIGSEPNGRWFNGKVQDVRIYNRALTQQEVSILYQCGLHNNVQISKAGTMYCRNFNEVTNG